MVQMNLAAFEAFVKVMETGSISLAADQLFITPTCGDQTHSQPRRLFWRETV